ncbi:MAG: RimK/LysX family protein [Gammaproteobacteria bacterium]|nr:RimK/LysX family protein [Gammaproteobacteria bacterium]
MNAYCKLVCCLFIVFSSAALSAEEAGPKIITQGAVPEIEDFALGVQPVQTFGWAEFVMLDPDRRWKLNAKLDTGADTSSLDARNVRRVRVKNKRYVRFDVNDPETGETISLRRPYVRTVRIREHNGQHQRRRVVLMSICLGDQARTIEVTLADRNEFSFPMLLGRSALGGLAIVDPSLEWTRDPSCWGPSDKEADGLDAELTDVPAKP